MRLLIVSTDLRHMGGVVETVKLLLRELRGRVNVTAVPFGRRLNQTGLIRYLRILADYFYYSWFLCFNRFDVIHMNPSMNILSVLKESVLITVFFMFGYSGRILVFFHGWDQQFFERIVGGTVFSRIFRLILNRAGMVVVLSEEFRESLSRAGIDRSKVQVVSTMVDMGSVPDSCSCKDDGKSLLFLSRMIKGKGADELLEAFSLLSGKYEGLKLVMAGDGPERERLMEKSASLKLKNAFFPGYIRDEAKSSTLAQSCVFLLPSKSEGCPVSLLEAMSVGLVPVVTGVGGIKDVVKPGQTAVLLDEVSAEAIAGAVSGLIDDPGLRGGMSEFARSYAREHFDSRTVTEKILAFYELLNSQMQNGGVA
ncbi:glycosyltransferase family 4 protein [Desulfovibrio sp. JC022]|uniref:glycosyltransferase family 4 protein n=1 Tax=Desulfovibrio sp. JC022 TaxID=2593642 RepID=UPI0013D4F1BF|nr:glycosyltransferase family 4 protein [Desulfovibrio sp. JC022]NDV21848.1 glycosyltransferase family 4 protein [Desulfovibrio sp. JC022]